jgi:hypothetical protein
MMFGTSAVLGAVHGTLPYGAAQKPAVQATPPGHRSGVRGQQGVPTDGLCAAE